MQTINEKFGDDFNRPNGIYLLSHSIGLMPSDTQQYLDRRYFANWSDANQHTWPKWLEAINEFTSELGTLLNSPAQQFCPQTNVSSGLSKLIQSLANSDKRNVILASERDFPSAGFVLEQAQRLGYTLRLIPKEEDIQSTETWNEYLNDDVHCVFITQVLYSSNALVPVKEICELARKRDIFSIIDMAQAAGIVPIDLEQIKPDAAIGSCIKWLCGGPGAGYLWIAKERIMQLEPLDVGWFSHQDPFEFDINNFEFSTSASRFWGGTPSVIPFVIATNSLRLINKIGMESIRHHNQELTKELLKNTPEECLSSPLDPENKGGTIVVDFSILGHSTKHKIESKLKKHNVHFDGRELGLRFSPHVYNNLAEVEKIAELLSV